MDRLITFSEFADLFDDQKISLKNNTWHYDGNDTGIKFQDPGDQLRELRSAIKSKKFVQKSQNSNLAELEKKVYKSLKKQFSLEELNKIKVNFDESQYYYDGKETLVGYGASNEICKNPKLVCAGGDKFGWIPQQGWLLRKFISTI
jgi:hypothetical protein